MLRYLRIVVSVPCLIACLLLIVLWVRSYWWFDTVRGHIVGWDLNIRSVPGELSLIANVQSRYFNWELSSEWIGDQGFGLLWWPPNDAKMLLPGVFGVSPSSTKTVVWMHHWFPILLTTTFAGFPWIKWSWRFSLRALLIAMTLIAVVLGLIVAFGR